MITGNSAKLQIGVESTYGTAATTTQEIQFISESLRRNLNKKDEGVLTGGRSTSKSATLAKSTGGNLSFLARPDDLGYILGCLLGVEATPALIAPSTTAYKHTYTALKVTDSARLPSLTVKIDRIKDIFVYAGVKIDSVSFSAQPEDFLKLDVSLFGKSETGSGTLATLTPSALKAFRFAWGSLTYKSGTVGDITSIKLNYNNNLVKNIQTTGSGYYYYEPDPAARDIQVELEALYNTDVTAFETAYSDDSLAKLELTFTSEEEADTVKNIPYKLIFTLNNVQITDYYANVGGADAIKAQIKAKAVEKGTDELITVELHNTRSTKYIS